ncbi:MAG: DUF2306 domain-containing protein [Brevundimonas sp.]|nr:MAG: DUF2306 domain-containing protein [Brevundimonas sp.]
MRRVTTWAGFGLMSFLCLATALFSARFLLPTPFLTEGMAAHLEARPAVLLTHVAGGVTALALGAFQLVTWRGPRRWWHRAAGRVYVVACLVGAVAGMGLALTTQTGPLAGLGFGLLAVAWFGTTSLAWRKAVVGEFAQHRRWMIRSLALTFAAVTLRIMLPVAAMSPIDFATAYTAIAFLCWIPNLAVIELWLRLKG